MKWKTIKRGSTAVSMVVMAMNYFMIGFVLLYKGLMMNHLMASVEEDSMIMWMAAGMAAILFAMGVGVLVILKIMLEEK